MSTVKKIIKHVVEEGVEVVKDSTKQIAGAVSPDKLIEQAVGPKKSSSELTEYLKNLDPGLSQEELKIKTEEWSRQQEEGIEDAQKVIRSAIPPHMRLPQKQPAARAGEVRVQEEERKKAQQVEANRRQPLAVPKGTKKSPTLPGAEKPKGVEGMLKDTRTG